jgi:hypothetical protein
MRNIIIENELDFEGIPEELKEILTTRFLENRIFFYNFSAVASEMSPETELFFDNIECGDNLIGQTRFREVDAIEKFIPVLKYFMRKNKRLNLFIYLDEKVYGSIEEAFAKYISRRHAYVTPAAVNKREYKVAINELFQNCIAYHQIYRMRSSDPEDDILVRYENLPLTAPAKSA